MTVSEVTIYTWVKKTFELGDGYSEIPDAYVKSQKQKLQREVIV